MPFPGPQSPFTAIYRGGPILGPAHKKSAPSGALYKEWAPDQSGALFSSRADPLEDDLGSYFGGDGIAEEWWSTISQRSPFLT